MSICVEVVYAMPDEQTVIAVELPDGATVAQALAASGIFARHPRIDSAECAVGIWGRVVERARVLRDRDRIEIYRPLVVDPKQLRRVRAQKQRGGA
jgi:putative ubiquitin-RnfH superfamily antitoxin RatB of RatAB toxin-antitoxin module